MVITNGGNVGIGTSTPQFPLDINGRMRLNGTNPNDPGIWLNDAGTDRAFIGLQNDNHVGFYGPAGLGWGFTMNTGTGALALNGNEGQAGQVIQSNGGGSSPTWVSPTNTLYNNSNIVTSTALLTLYEGDPKTLIPGLSYSFTVSGNAKVLVSFTIPVRTYSCTFCNSSSANLYMQISGYQVGAYSLDIVNGATVLMSGNTLFPVSPGTYTISILADVFGPEISFFQNSFYATNCMIVQVFPQ